MPSLFAAYISERENKQIIESDKGFATYIITPDTKSCYIESIFVHPDYRDNRIASDMADQIAGIAKEKGCDKLYGSVAPSTNGSTASLKVLLAYGFKLDSSTNNFILMKKEI